MEEKLIEYLEAFESLAVEYTPQAIELASWVARISAIQVIATGIVYVLVAWFLMCLANRFVRRGKEIYRSDESYNYEMWFVLGTFSCLGSIGLFAASLLKLLNIFAWVGMFRPEVWIVYKALNVATGGG